MRFNAIYTMPRKNYEAPSTRYQMVEGESTFCGASSEVTNPDKDNGRIEEHSTFTDFSGNFADGGWDSEPSAN